jgi:hypothetical protein
MPSSPNYPAPSSKQQPTVDPGSRPSFSYGSNSPIAQVGESPVNDRFGRTPEGDQAWIKLANGVQISAPPGKDLVALRGDANNCRYGGGGSDVNAYLACLHNAGDAIHYPNGKTLNGATPFDDLRQTSREQLQSKSQTDRDTPSSQHSPSVSRPPQNSKVFAAARKHNREWSRSAEFARPDSRFSYPGAPGARDRRRSRSCINPADEGPRVRIHLPPAASQQRTEGAAAVI